MERKKGRGARPYARDGIGLRPPPPRPPAPRQSLRAPITSASLSAPAQVMAPCFRTVSARLHRAPSPRPVLAVVEKEPEATAVGAFAHVSPIRPRQDIRRRPQRRREHRCRRRLHLGSPSETSADTLEVGTRRRFTE